MYQNIWLYAHNEYTYTHMERWEGMHTCGYILSLLEQEHEYKMETCHKKLIKAPKD